MFLRHIKSVSSLASGHWTCHAPIATNGIAYMPSISLTADNLRNRMLVPGIPTRGRLAVILTKARAISRHPLCDSSQSPAPDQQALLAIHNIAAPGRNLSVNEAPWLCGSPGAGQIRSACASNTLVGREEYWIYDESRIAATIRVRRRIGVHHRPTGTACATGEDCGCRDNEGQFPGENLLHGRSPQACLP